MDILLLYAKHPEIPWPTARYFEKSLRKNHNVEVFDLSQAPNLNTIHGLPAIWRNLKNISLKDVLNSCKQEPDLIIEVDSLGSHHLKDYDKIEIPRVFYAIDSHLYNKLKFQKRIAKDFDYIFVAHKKYVNIFKEIVENVYWLPLAADPEIHKKYDVPKLFDIGFVGSKNPKRHPDRVRLLNELSKKYSVLVVEGVWGENMSKIYSLSKIGFNKSISGDLNMRVFEIMSCGTMLLTDRINGLEDLFKNGKHLVVYENEKELIELVQYYLENEDEREKIAKKGRKEVHEKHTYDRRAEYMIRKIRG